MKNKINKIIDDSCQFNKEYSDIKNKIDTSQYIKSKSIIDKFNFKLASAICLILLIFASLSIILVNNIKVVSKIIDELKTEQKNPLKQDPKALNEVFESIELYDEFYISHIDSENVSINLYKTEYNKLFDNINSIYTLNIKNSLDRTEFITINYNKHIKLIINDKDNIDNQIIFYIYNQSESYDALFVYSKKTNKYYEVNISINDLTLFTNELCELKLDDDVRFNNVLIENFETQVIKGKAENLEIKVLSIIGTYKDIYVIRSNYIKEGYYSNKINGFLFKDDNNPNPIYLWHNDIIYTLSEAINKNIISDYQLQILHYNFQYMINEEGIKKILDLANKEIKNYFGVFGENNAIVLSIENNNVEKIQYIMGVEINNYYNTELIIYYNNKIYSMEEAYKEKLIDYKNIQEIAYLYNPNKELLSNIYDWINTLESNQVTKIQLVTIYNSLPTPKKEIIEINTKEEIESIIISLKETYYYTPNFSIINNQNNQIVGGYSSRVLYIYTINEQTYELSSDGNFILPQVTNK